MLYAVYKITNAVNGKIYVGVHKTDNLNDGYMGSGVVLKQAQTKYGIENFTKEYIQIFDNEDDMFNMESAIVDTNFVLREDTYNLREGGSGGFTREEAKLGRLAADNALREKYGDDWLSTLGKMRRSAVAKEAFDLGVAKATETMLARYGARTSFVGKSHTTEAKVKIGSKNSKHQTGKGNSQFGTCWIHSLEEKRSQKIKKDELNSYLEQGWIKGRKLKF